MADKPTRASVVRETLSLSESTIDSDHMAIRGVTILRAGFSTNTDKAGRKRYYPVETVRNSVDAFEGAVVHVNHPSRNEKENLPEGDAMGVRGYYENVRYDESSKSLKGDQILLDRKSTRDELWPIVKEAVEKKSDLIQMSINAVGHSRLGKAEGEKEAVIIESIIKDGNRPNRVDIVTAGAAGGTYAGASIMASDDGDLTDSLLAAAPFEQWRESHPDYIETLKKEWRVTRDTDALKESNSKIETLQTTITALEEAGRDNAAALEKYKAGELADRLLSESTLPIKLRSTIRAQLLEAEDEEAMKKVLEAETAKAKLAAQTIIPTHAGTHVAPAPVVEVKRTNYAAQLLGISESVVALPNESIDEYKARRNQQLTS